LPVEGGFRCRQYRRISRSRWAGSFLVALVWDGLAAHLGRLLRAWLGRQRSWLVVEPLPGYPPKLNPVGPLWASLKGTGLAILVGDTLEEIIAAAERGIQRIRPPRTYRFRSCALRTVPMVRTTSLEPATFFGLAHAGSL
jgi:hypothetical protein